MIYDLREESLDTIKFFDGTYNYFNPSGYLDKVIMRREGKHDNKVLVSDIISNTGEIILENYVDDKYLWSFEDARLLNDDEMSVCCCRRYREDLMRIHNVEFKVYNIKSKSFRTFKTQNSHFEKHWQFWGGRILYHVNPYTLLDNNEEIVYRDMINWEPWISRYGKPGLSTNIFEVWDKKYVLFHSYVTVGRLYYKYYIGIMRLDELMRPIGYCLEPLFESNRDYSDLKLLNDLWKWRKTELSDPVKYEVIFPMNVDYRGDYILIYAGINDCSAGIITLSMEDFDKRVSNNAFILI